MENDLIEAARQLVDTLDHAALYNDKGYQWSGHAPAQSQGVRAGFQATLDQLAARIGMERLGQPLWEAIKSGAAAQDDSGDVVNLARRMLRQLEN